LDSEDTPMKNVTSDTCEAVCDSTPECVAFSRFQNNTDRHNQYGDCYLRSNVSLSECDVEANSSWWNSPWTTEEQTAPPPLTGIITYHLFEPKYTGLENRDAGDFKGDAGFIFGTFGSWSKGNPEASMEHNIIEMSEVTVTGWGKYEECNAPGAVGMFTCPENQTEYCCTMRDNGKEVPTHHTATQLPGVEVGFSSLGPAFGFSGWWYSFPMESQGITWTEKNLRRVAGKCMGNAWRQDAGGCSHCGKTLDTCVADCIKAALCVNGSVTDLQVTWDRVFADPDECPEVAPPSDTEAVGIVV